MRISTIADPFALAYGTQAVIGINILGGNVNTAATELAASRSVQSVGILAGSYDIIAWTVFRHLEDLLNFSTDELGRISGVASAEIMIAMKIAKADFTLFTHDNNRQHPRVESLSNPDALDLAMIRELQKDARQTIKGLAQKLDVSRNTAQKRLQFLLERRTVQITTIADPSVFGYTMRGAILIKAHPGKVKAVTDTLADYKGVQSLIITTGRYNIVAWTIFRDHDDMSRFRNELSNIPGIISNDFLVSLRIAKVDFALPADGNDESHAMKMSSATDVQSN